MPLVSSSLRLCSRQWCLRLKPWPSWVKVRTSCGLIQSLKFQSTSKYLAPRLRRLLLTMKSTTRAKIRQTKFTRVLSQTIWSWGTRATLTESTNLKFSLQFMAKTRGYISVTSRSSDLYRLSSQQTRKSSLLSYSKPMMSTCWWQPASSSTSSSMQLPQRSFPGSALLSFLFESAWAMLKSWLMRNGNLTDALISKKTSGMRETLALSC